MSYDSGDDLLAAARSAVRAIPEVCIAVQEHSLNTDTITRVEALADELGVAIRTRHDPANPGFGAGCNALARTSDATWLLFLNPDAEVLEWPYPAGGPTLRAVLGPSGFHGPRPESHRGVTYTVGDEARRSWLRKWGPPPDGTGFVSGAALLVHRDDHTRIGEFDERYFLFYEDIEYCLRANRLGVPTHLVPGWSVGHAGAHSTSPRFAAALTWSYESGCRFHGSQRESVAAYRCYVGVDAMLRWVIHLARRDARRRAAYGQLARRAVGDLLRRAAI